jgi:hypothetical protein
MSCQQLVDGFLDCPGDKRACVLIFDSACQRQRQHAITNVIELREQYAASAWLIHDLPVPSILGREKAGRS